MSDIGYTCPHCGKHIALPADKPAPACCGVTLKADPLPYCTKVPNAEMDREIDADAPCADGTASKKG
jgi:hypothetical protein